MHEPQLSPEAAEYIGLLDRTNNLMGKRRSLTTEAAKLAIDTGLSRADEQITELGRKQEVVDWFALKGKEAAEILEVVSDLRGLIDDEELDHKAATARTTVEVVQAFAARHGLDGVQLGFTNTTPDDASVEPTTQMLPTDLTAISSESTGELMPKSTVNLMFLVGAKGTKLKIGSYGNSSALSKAKSDGQRDYTELRKKAIEILAENQDGIRTVDLLKQLVEGLDIDARDYRNIQLSVLSWVRSLTYRQGPLFIHNGSRGAGASLRVNPTRTIVIEPIKHIRVKETDSHTKPRLTEITTIEREASKNPINYLDLREASLFVNLMSEYAALLEVLGIKAPDANLVNKITEASEIEDSRKQVVRESKTKEQLQGERNLVLDKVSKIFSEDPSKLDQLIAELSESDPLYLLLNYITDVDSEECWDTLKNQILKATFQESTIHDPRPRASSNILSFDTLVTLPNGRKFIVSKSNTDRGNTTVQEVVRGIHSGPTEHDRSFTLDSVVSSPEPHSPANMQPKPLVSSSPRSTLSKADSAAKGAARVPVHEPVNNSVESSKSRREKLTDADKRKVIGEAINALRKDGLLDSREPITSKLVSTLSTSTKMGTDEALRRLEGNGVLKLGKKNTVLLHTRLSPEQVIAMYLQNSHQNQLFTTRGIAKSTMLLIRTCLDSFFNSQGL